MPLKRYILFSILLCGLSQGVQAQDCAEEGYASYYAGRFHGRLAASGLRYDQTLFTAAHKTRPFGTLLLVKDPSSGKSVTVVVTDRGPFVKGRVIDLSRVAAEELNIVTRGIGKVLIYCLPKTLPFLTPLPTDTSLPALSPISLVIKE